METVVVRRFCLIICLLAGVLVAGTALAETFKLTTGETMTGEVLASSANDAGVQVKVGEGKYEKVPWASFSQDDLKKFAQNKKLDPFVEPFIEISQEEKVKKTEVNIKQPPRLERPTGQSLFGALLSSGLGMFLMFLLYAANVFAAYEVAIFRGRPVPLVCGVAAVLPVIRPILFLSLPVKLPPPPDWEVAAEPVAEAAGADAANPMLDPGMEHPAGLKIAHSEPEATAASLPPTTTYQRGQFTFNRRFFETKFPGFFGVVRRDADRDMVLAIKSSRGQYVGDRISRIAANDLHLQVHRGNASEEVMIPFQEILEIKLKHKDA